MIKVLVILELKDTTTEAFKKGYAEWTTGIPLESRILYADQVGEDDINWCDMVIAIRPNNPLSVGIAKTVKRSRKPYYVFFDDDLLNLEGTLGWRKKCTMACLAEADLMIGVNPLLCEEYAAMTASGKYFLTKSPVDLDLIVPPEPAGDVVQFIYAAGRAHAVFFEKFIKPVLPEFLKEYEGRVHFTFVGVSPDVSDLGYDGSFTFVPLMPIAQYDEYMRSHHFDAGLSPLFDNHFSSRKYFNKFIEYSVNGIAGLYSDCLPYTFIVRDGVNGKLVGYEEGSWLEALKWAADSGMTEKIAANAQKQLREEFNCKSLAEAFEREVFRLPEGNVAKDIKYKKNMASYYAFLFADRAKKLLLRLKDKGISGAIDLVKTHIKDKNM